MNAGASAIQRKKLSGERKANLEKMSECPALLFIQTHTISYSFYSSVTVYCKAERKKIYRKPVPTSLWFKNPYRNLKSENYTQKPQWIGWSWIRLLVWQGLYDCEFWSRIQCTILLRFLGIILLPNTRSMAQSGTHIAILCNSWGGTFPA
jgi:hypothetical protein